MAESQWPGLSMLRRWQIAASCWSTGVPTPHPVCMTCPYRAWSAKRTLGLGAEPPQEPGRVGRGQ